MMKLVSFRPGVISENTAFEPMALIYKYLQRRYNYHFTIVKLSIDKYENSDFNIVSIPAKGWNLSLSRLSLLISMNDSQVLNSLFQAADGILTVDPINYEQGLFAIAKATAFKKPIWFDTSLTIAKNSSDPIWRLKRRFVLRKALKQTTGIIATVPKCLERFQDLGILDENIASKFTIMGHPVDVTQFVSGVNLSKSDGVLRVLVVSRMTPEKGLLYILEAMIPILKMNEHVHLQLLGSGVIRPLLEQEVIEHGLSKQVIFLNPIPHRELPRVLNQADVFVNHALSIASWEEYFGAVNLEAMACELPCIFTDSGGIPYAIREKDVAMFVEERNIVQLREAITYLLNHEQARVEMGQKARSYVKEYYGLPVIAEKYHRMLQRGFSANTTN